LSRRSSLRGAHSRWGHRAFEHRAMTLESHARIPGIELITWLELGIVGARYYARPHNLATVNVQRSLTYWSAFWCSNKTEIALVTLSLLFSGYFGCRHAKGDLMLTWLIELKTVDRYPHLRANPNLQPPLAMYRFTASGETVSPGVLYHFHYS
jgi:hypothetical protein